MKVINYENKKGFKNKHSIKKAVKLKDNKNIKIIHMTLDPGDYVIDHVTPFDVSFYVARGKVEMKIGDENKIVEPGSLVESPADIVHGFKNNFDNEAQVLVIKHIKGGR